MTFWLTCEEAHLSDATKQEFRFEVALSFAGDDKRNLVRSIAEILRDELGEGKVFFDEWYEAELAGTDADIVLQRIYNEKSRLVVSCVCRRYNEKPWTQDEWRAIRSLERTLRDGSLDNLQRLRFLPLRFGDGEVDGLFDTAIVPDKRSSPPRDTADLVLKRLKLIKGEVDSPPRDASHRESTHLNCYI